MRQDQMTIAKCYCCCGRFVLEVAGIVVAMQGDKCRHDGIPEEFLEPIPQEELDRATIGGKSVKDMPMQLVRFFRGDNWTPEMLRWAADSINKKAYLMKGG